MKKPPLRLGRGIALSGVVAAVFIAVLVNVLGARHYKRWDLTASKRYTLSAATLSTLHDLPSRVDIWVVLGRNDPLLASVKQLLESYRAETSKLEVHFLDPDLDGLKVISLYHTFNLDPANSVDGRPVADAVVFVTQDKRRNFLTPNDLFEVVSETDPRAKPREEQAITGAIRATVRGGDTATLCFTTGHGELDTKPNPRGWIGELKNVLERDQLGVRDVDPTLPDAHEPYKGCSAVVIAGPGQPFSAEEANRLRTYLLEGGNALLAIGPIFAPSESGLGPSGLDTVVAPFGIELGDGMVIAEENAFPGANGTDFLAQPSEHVITEPLMTTPMSPSPPKIRVRFVRPLRKDLKDDAPAPQDLLTTPEQAFATLNLRGAEDWTGPPTRQKDDPKGPFVVAMASERPKLAKDAKRGPRVVVLGTSAPLHQQSWHDPRDLRGATFLVENAIAWLTARPPLLDIPERPPVAAGVRLTEEDWSSVLRYVLLLLPAGAALLGVLVFLLRRSTEGAPYKPKWKG